MPTNRPLKIEKHILEYARELRKNSTEAEKFLWVLLRDRRFGGLKFRRQYPVENYILDFYCPARKTAIELDGGGHNEVSNIKSDEIRSRRLEERGIRVMRFWNNEVLLQYEAVLQVMWEALSPLPGPHPGPLPKGEGDSKEEP